MVITVVLHLHPTTLQSTWLSRWWSSTHTPHPCRVHSYSGGTPPTPVQSTWLSRWSSTHTPHPCRIHSYSSGTPPTPHTPAEYMVTAVVLHPHPTPLQSTWLSLWSSTHTPHPCRVHGYRGGPPPTPLQSTWLSRWSSTHTPAEYMVIAVVLSRHATYASYSFLHTCMFFPSLAPPLSSRNIKHTTNRSASICRCRGDGSSTWLSVRTMFEEKISSGKAKFGVGNTTKGMCVASKWRVQ